MWWQKALERCSGVMLVPLGSIYVYTTLLVILCGCSLTFLIIIRDPLCRLMPCEQPPSI